MEDKRLSNIKKLMKQREAKERERNPVEALAGTRTGKVYTGDPHWINARVWNGRNGGYDDVLVKIPDQFHSIVFRADELIEVEGYGPERVFSRKLAPMSTETDDPAPDARGDFPPGRNIDDA